MFTASFNYLDNVALASFSPSFSACSRSFALGAPSTATPGFIHLGLKVPRILSTFSNAVTWLPAPVVNTHAGLPAIACL
ncbi:MAG: hypothetical protein QXG39_06170 [Candidatus Aenigmatarchaeota archaeon]